MTRRTLYFFRHGQTDWNLERRLQGHKDIPLNATGLEQAEDLSLRCIGLGIERVVSSDLARAAQTARAVTRKLNVPLELTSRLRECNMGEMEGKTLEEFGQELGPERLAEWFGHAATREELEARLPGGESRGELAQRVLDEVEHVLASRHERVIAFSSHGGALRRALGVLFGEREELQRIANTALYEISHDMDTGEFVFIGQVK